MFGGIQMINIDDLLNNYRNSDEAGETPKYDTTINHTKMEQLIYNDKKKKVDELYGADFKLEQLEQNASEKLSSFKALGQDVFNMLYKINPSDREENELTTTAQKFNKQIIQKVKENPDYGALKLITEGKDLESMEGAREFVKELSDNLDELLKDVAGDQGTLNRIEKLEDAIKSKSEQLKAELGIYDKMSGGNASKGEMAGVEDKIKSLQQQIDGMKKQIGSFDEIMEANAINNKEKIEKKLSEALKTSLEKVNEVKDTIEMFGTEDGRPTTIEGKTELISKVKNNTMFQKLAKELGKLRRMAKATMNKRFTYGRGQKVGIEFGNKLSKVLPSELALLALPETEALFYKKFNDKKLKQYKEQTEKFEGRGHVIYMVDESSSTDGERAIWAKALGIAMMDISVKDHRNFAFIPFDTKVGNVQHISYENYSEDIVLKIAETFLGGGTNFTEPIKLATKLIDEDAYENADMVFVTDGHAHIDEATLKAFLDIKAKKKCKCVGILLDKGGNGHVSDATIKKFCDVVYRTSQLSSDSIAENVMNGVV
jgi:uncharacterized protein with von Willebrand factor type A (vWA) domain